MKYSRAYRLVADAYHDKPPTASDPVHNAADFWRGFHCTQDEGHFTPEELALLLRHKRHHAIMGLASLGCGDRGGLDRLHAMLDALHAEGLAA